MYSIEQLKEYNVIYTVSVSWPSALHCNPCPHCSPGNVPSPHPNSSTLMDIPSVKTGKDIYVTIQHAGFPGRGEYNM